MDDMDDDQVQKKTLLESGGWRRTAPVTAWCMWRDKTPPPLPVISFIFLPYPQSLFTFQHMTLSHRLYHPPRPVLGAPARRLRRPSARCSDPMAIGKLVRSRLHKVSIL